MLSGIAAEAARHPDRIRFVATAGTVPELLAEDVGADVVLLDLRLGDGSRPRDNVRLLVERGYRVLVYSSGDMATWMADAVHAGALGIVVKSQTVTELLAAIEDVVQDLPVLSPEMADLIRRDAEFRPQLAPREEQTLRLVAQGLADKQAARVMDISQETVKEYLKRIRIKYRELGRSANSRVELAQRAHEDGYSDGQRPQRTVPEPREKPGD